MSWISGGSLSILRAGAAAGAALSVLRAGAVMRGCLLMRLWVWRVLQRSTSIPCCPKPCPRAEKLSP